MHRKIGLKPIHVQWRLRHNTELDDVLLDSKEGMEHLARWARAHGAVLDEWHERLAVKWDVPFDGIVIRRQIPTD